MKKIFTFVLVLCSFLLATSASAANTIFNEDFEDTDLTDCENVEFSLTRIIEEDGNKYIQGNAQSNPVAERFEITLKEGEATDYMVISTDFKAVLSESEQISFVGINDSNPWQRVTWLYNALIDDTQWHKLLLVCDFNNEKTIVVVDGKVISNTNWADCEWTSSGAGAKFRIEAYCLSFDNTVIMTDDCDNYFGISDILFNDVDLADNNGDFGQLGSDLSKISVKMDFPLADNNVAPITVNGGAAVVESSVYNTETGCFDITIKGLEPGTPYTISTAENLMGMLDAQFKSQTYTFSVAESDFEFSQMDITVQEGTRAEITIRNNKFSPSDATVVIFVYDSEGIMVDCVAGVTESIAPMTSESVYAELTNPYTDGYTVSAFVWDNVISALPLMSIN